MKNNIIPTSSNLTPVQFRPVPKEQFFTVKKNTKRLKISTIFSQCNLEKQQQQNIIPHVGPKQDYNEYEFPKLKEKQLCSTIGTNSFLSFKRKQPKRKKYMKIKNQNNKQLLIQNECQNSIFNHENLEKPIIQQKQELNICQLILSLKIKDNLMIKKSGFSKEDFIFLHKIGQGTYSEVYIAIQKDTGFVVSLKILSKDKVKDLGFQDNLLNQIKIQFYLNHPNITKLYGFFHDELFIYLITEFAVDQNLYDTLSMNKKNGKQGLEFQDSSKITGQICHAISYMHNNNIIHRDIKPQNILITFKDTVKLCDFGWSVHNPDKSLRSTLCGTPFYLAPELIMHDSYDESVDVWAIGILTYELLTNSSPFKIKNLKQLKNVVTTQVSYFKIKQPQSIDFIENCLKKKKQERYDINQLMQHSFLNPFFEQYQE